MSSSESGIVVEWLLGGCDDSDCFVEQRVVEGEKDVRASVEDEWRKAASPARMRVDSFRAIAVSSVSCLPTEVDIAPLAPPPDTTARRTQSLGPHPIRWCHIVRANSDHPLTLGLISIFDERGISFLDSVRPMNDSRTAGSGVEVQSDDH